jgi:hypothetical protein
MSTTPVKIATRAFVAEIGGERIDIAEGERVVAGHEIVAAYPDHFRTRELEEELAIRSDWVAEMRRQEDERRAPREPLSRAARAEREATRFWDGVTRELERTAPDQPTREERQEQAFFDRALAQIEESDTRELAEFNDEAARDFGFDRGWSRRVSG